MAIAQTLYRRAQAAPHLVLLLASSATLGMAYVFQYGFGLAPCALCYTQRYPYMVVIALAALATLLAGRTNRWLLPACGLALLAGAGIAGFHVGVEQKWWPGPAACSALDLTGDIDAALDQIMAAPVVRCDDVAWSLFGISMAGYNGLISLALAAFAAVSWRQSGRTSAREPRIADKDAEPAR